MGPDSDPFDRDIDEDDEFEDHQSMYDEDESGRTGKEVDDTEQLSELPKKAFKEAAIYIIDAAPKMFVQDPQGRIPFVEALDAVLSAMSSLVFEGDYTYTALLIYNSKNYKLATYPKVIDLIPLSLPDPVKIAALNEIIGDLEQIRNEVAPIEEHESRALMVDVLQVIANTTSTVAKVISATRVYWITNEDNPIGLLNNVQEETAMINRMRDFNERNVKFYPFVLDPPSESDHRVTRKFNMDRYWNKLFSQTWPDEESYSQALEVCTEGSLETLGIRVKAKSHRKRCHFKGLWKLSGDMTIGIRGYSLYGTTKFSSYTKLYRLTNMEAQKFTAYTDGSSGNILTKSEIFSSVVYGGRKDNVIIQPEEWGVLCQVTEEKELMPGLTLIGFKPISSLKYSHQLKPSIFLHPDECEYEGSFTVFAALWKRCQALNVIPICRYLPRKSAVAKFMALIPSPPISKNDFETKAASPDGFYGIVLPFHEDVRDISEVPHHGKRPFYPTYEPIVNPLQETIRKLRYNEYLPQNYPNPGLNRSRAVIQAEALNYESPVPIEDNILPDYETIEKTGAVAILEDVQKRVWEEPNVQKLVADTYQPISGSGKRKRGEGGSIDGTSGSKAVLDLTKDEMLQLVETMRINQITIPSLKLFLKTVAKVKFPSSAKKADLIELVEKYFQR